MYLLAILLFEGSCVVYETRICVSNVACQFCHFAVIGVLLASLVPIAHFALNLLETHLNTSITQ